MRPKWNLRILAWSVDCVFCAAKPGEPCIEQGEPRSKTRIYRGFSFKTRMLTRPCFHGARWKKAHALSVVDKLATLGDPRWRGCERRFPAIRFSLTKTPEYTFFVEHVDEVRRSLKEAHRAARG